MEKHENKQFENIVIRSQWDSAQNKWQYAVTDILEALTGPDNGRKHWNRYKQKAKNAGADISADCTRIRLPGADGKMRMTDTATSDQLLRITQAIPTDKAEALAAWLTAHAAAPSKKPGRKPRKSAAKTPAPVTEAPAVQAEALQPDTPQTPNLHTDAPQTEASASAPQDAPKATRSRKTRRGGKASAKLSEPAKPEPVKPEPAKPVPVTRPEPSKPVPVQRPAPTTRVEAKAAAPKASAEKAKDKSVPKLSEKSTQKAVTKAVAKAAAKAAVKAAERVVEKAAERPALDKTEKLRMEIGKRESIAILIDADNSQFTKLKATIDVIAGFGRVVVKKAYGDWKNPCLKNWEGVLTELAIKPEQQFAYTKGKNATDIALVIDAMDLMATGRYDTFAIICSDSDYTPLVMRLRETGAYVFGAGADRTPAAFIKACDVFLNVSDYIEKKYEQPTALLPKAPSPNNEIEDIFHWMENARDLYKDADGWTSISDAGSYIKRIYPGFRVKKYGYPKLADLVAAFPDRYETKTYIHKGATIVAYKPMDAND